jgi:SanA protein
MKSIFMHRFFRKLFKAALIIILLLAILIVAINIYVSNYSNDKIYTEIKDVPYAYTALVPGSLVYKDSSLSLIVKDRVDKAIELYKAGKVKRILVSGDHGREKYDEVNCMKKYLKEQDIPEEDIFTDHAGFDTYSSIVRANKVFKVDSMIIVSQEYHLRRALYIAGKKDLIVYGYVSDKRTYPGMRGFKIREYLANVKAFFYVLFNISPHFLGPEIPITGDSKKSYD